MIRTSSRGIPAFNENAVLKLIIACGSGFVIYNLIRVTIMVAGGSPTIFPTYFEANIAMPAVEHIQSKWWTILTYSWTHSGFWVLFSNMVWLYVFGSVVQMLVGHRQLIPLFIYCMIVAGIFYQLGQLIPGDYFNGRQVMLGAQGGVVGLSVAALALAPGYKFYLGETMRIPLGVIAIIFYALQLMNANVNYEGAPLMLLVGGAVMGYVYVLLLRNGYQPGGWAYNIIDGVNRKFDIEEHAHVNRQNTRRNKTMSMYSPRPSQGITQNKIDEILDKINQKGYDALSKEDKDTLMKASGKKDA